MVQQFYRKLRFCEVLDIRETKFDSDRKAGIIPEPDGYLGTRLPFWLESTVAATQAKYVGRKAEAA